MRILIIAVICTLPLGVMAENSLDREQVSLDMPALLAAANSGVVEMHIAGEDLVLEVEPTSIWTDDFKAYMGSGRDRREVDVVFPSMFAGKVRGYRDSDVRLTISSNTAWVKGYISVNGTWRFIGPVDLGGPTTPMREHVVSGQSRPEDDALFQDILDLDTWKHADPDNKDSRTGLFLVPVGDHEYYAINTNTWFDRMSAQIGNVAGLFLSTLNISFEVPEYHMNVAFNGTDGPQVMNQLVEEFKYIDDIRRQVIHLLSGKNFDGENLGLSRNGIGRVQGYTLAQVTPEGNLVDDDGLRMLVSSHEIAHCFGAIHDNAESIYIWWDLICFYNHYTIMWPSFNGSCTESFFSQANIDEMEDHDDYLDDWNPSGATLTISEGQYSTSRDLNLFIEIPQNNNSHHHVFAVSETQDPYPIPATIAVGIQVSANITLSVGDGERTVYAHVKDRADNLTVVSETIILDTTAPTAAENLASETHVVGQTSALTEVRVIWDAAVDETLGLAGYSHLWSENSASDPDDNPTLPAGALSATSPTLGDGSWYFAIKALDNAGWAGPVTRIGPFVIDTVSGVDDLTGPVPQNFFMKQNYPNPFNPNTEIAFGLPYETVVSVRIYNVFGKLVRTLLEQKMPAGRHSIQWQGRDDRGKVVSSGVFFCHIQMGDNTMTRKMTLMK